MAVRKKKRVSVFAVLLLLVLIAALALASPPEGGPRAGAQAALGRRAARRRTRPYRHRRRDRGRLCPLPALGAGRALDPELAHASGTVTSTELDVPR